MFDPRFWLVVGGVAAAAALQGPLGQTNADRRRNDFRYTPDADVARVLSLGHRSTLANTIWLRGLPDFAREFRDKKLKKRWLAGVFDVVTELEPGFFTAYWFGSTYLTLVDRDDTAAIELLESGCRRMLAIEEEDGQEYYITTRLHIELGMTYYMWSKDKEKALEALEFATRRPDCDALTRNMVVAMKMDEGEDLVALTYAATNLDSPNRNVREKAEEDFERTKMRMVRREARRFLETHTREPVSIAELREFAPGVPELIWDGAEMDADGVFAFPKHAATELRATLHGAEYAARIYRDNHDEWPPLEWLTTPGWDPDRPNGLGTLPRPPAGQAWHFDPATGKASVIDLPQ